jgi:hypothetical protein
LSVIHDDVMVTTHMVTPPIKTAPWFMRGLNFIGGAPWVAVYLIVWGNPMGGLAILIAILDYI